MTHTNFTPGPSQLYFTVHDHMRQAFREGIPSISHRSKQFENIFRTTTEGLRELLAIPETHHIYFTGSATEIWERIIQNLVERESFHLVNGAFSKRFYETAVQLGRRSLVVQASDGKGFENNLMVPETELIAITQNETSTGVSVRDSLIRDLRERNPESLIAVDAVSSLPYPDLDLHHIDTIFFSVQKGFGLPAGLGVWIANERCLEKASALSKKIPIGTYHSLPSLHANATKMQTPETPNVLGIYLLGKVVEDFLRRGIATIRRETDYKAALLYHTLDDHDLLRSFVSEKSFRSSTVIVAHTDQHTTRLTDFLAKRSLLPGDGYGSYRATQLRFANFPAHSKEQFELLADSLKAYTG